MPSELVLPAGVDWPAEEVSGTIVNDTDLPDRVVQQAVETYFEEHASVLGLSGATSFQTYANSGGSLLSRGRFSVPQSILEEIILARDLAERDDDIASTIGAALALTFGDGMRNQHADPITVALHDEICRLCNMDSALQEMYREWLIAGQFTTATLFSMEEVSYMPADGERKRNARIPTPRIGVIPAEQILVLENDMFGTAPLWFRPQSAAQEEWLREFFGESTTAARKAEMRRQDPVLTFLLVEARRMPNRINPSVLYTLDQQEPPASGEWIFRLNPNVVARSTMPKGSWPHPRPPLTRNFPLLEAKRLLNLMDYALLEGGSNFLVVAKKGSDQRPALPAEIENLHGTIRRAARSGVLVGDHRLSIEIITPDLEALLNPEKRKLLGRKLAMALLRIPDYQEDPSSGQAALAQVEILTRVLHADRRAIRRHVENNVYAQAAKRINAVQGPATMWFPRIILQGTQYFTDYILKLRDRGDISRRSAIEAGGFDYDFELGQRKLEKSRGDDRVMTPAEVPFSGGAGPQDNNSGRPVGSGPNNGRAGARRREQPARPARRVIARNAGETVTASYLEDEDTWTRIGEFTAAMLEEYESTSELGRITTREREALEMLAEHTDTFQHGTLTIIPVNSPFEVGDVRAVRLSHGMTAYVGNRIGDDAIVARALGFRSPEYDEAKAEEIAERLGFVKPDPADVEIPAGA